MSPQGLGYGILRALAASGANVGMHGIALTSVLEQQAAAVADEFGVQVAFSTADLRKPAAIRCAM